MIGLKVKTSTGWQTIAGIKGDTGDTGPTGATGPQGDPGIPVIVEKNVQIASYILQLSDAGKLIVMNVGSANDVTVPLNSSVAFQVGTQILIVQYGAGQTAIAPAIGVTVRSADGNLKIKDRYSAASLVKIDTDEWLLFGNLEA